jgi:hypothetical protein
VLGSKPAESQGSGAARAEGGSDLVEWSGVRTNAVKEPLLLWAIIRALQDADDRASGGAREQVDQAQPSNSTLLLRNDGRACSWKHEVQTTALFNSDRCRFDVLVHDDLGNFLSGQVQVTRLMFDEGKRLAGRAQVTCRRGPHLDEVLRPCWMWVCVGVRECGSVGVWECGNGSGKGQRESGQVEEALALTWERFSKARSRWLLFFGHFW